MIYQVHLGKFLVVSDLDKDFRLQMLRGIVSSLYDFNKIEIFRISKLQV